MQKAKNNNPYYIDLLSICNFFMSGICLCRLQWILLFYGCK